MLPPGGSIVPQIPPNLHHSYLHLQGAEKVSYAPSWRLYSATNTATPPPQVPALPERGEGVYHTLHFILLMFHTPTIIYYRYKPPRFCTLDVDTLCKHFSSK